jgi:hypothetical protein
MFLVFIASTHTYLAIDLARELRARLQWPSSLEMPKRQQKNKKKNKKMQ